MKPRIAIYTLVITLITCFTVGFAASGMLRSSAVDSARAQLETQARTLATMLSDGYTSDSNAAMERLRDVASSEGIRIQLIQSDGTVVADTRTLSGTITLDIADNPEIGEAFSVDSAYRLRREGSTDMMYVATAYSDTLVLRVVKSMSSVYKAVDSRIRMLCMWLAISPVLALALIVFMSRMLGNTAKQLHDGFKQLENGDFSARLTSQYADPDGLISGFNEMADQIERKWKSVRRRNHAMNMVTNTMQNGILAVDSDLHIVLINPAAKQMLGIVGSAEGMSISEASHDVRLNPVFTEAMAQEGVYTRDVVARTAVGRARRPLRLYVTALRDDGNTVGALALVEDVTELKRLEQVRTDFAANVSHELKTPLTSIKGFVETLQAGAINKPEMAQKFLNIIMLEADRLTRLINDILSISKLESGNDKVEMQALQLNTMASEICDLLRMHAEQKHITVNCAENAPQTLIWGNPDRVKQMLINLIDNAIKYTLDGGSVTVAVYKDDTTAYFSCSDTGIGIAEENIPRLFERFYRVDKGRSRSMGGTGLGLAIVKHIVLSMNGHIEVHSKLGEGTEFLISIPLYSGQTVQPVTGQSMDSADEIK